MSYPESCNYNPIGQLIENKAEQIQYFYNASGLVTEVWYEGSPKVKFMYNDRNHRVKKESYHNGNLLNSTFYVRDVAGQVMAIYTEDGSQPQLVEQPIYGAGRIGVQYTNDLAVYELTDHLGNVRALFTKESATDSKLEGYTDYYPFGMPMPWRKMQDADGYRYAYQGQEKDEETGKEAFQLRLWDSRIGRWLSPDPYGQFASPYLGMGNNPITYTDPDGGCIKNGEPCNASRTGERVVGDGGAVWEWDGDTWGLHESYSLQLEGFIGSPNGEYSFRDWQNDMQDFRAMQFEQMAAQHRAEFYAGRRAYGKGVAKIIGVALLPIAAAEGIPYLASRGLLSASTEGAASRVGYEAGSEFLSHGGNVGDMNLLSIGASAFASNLGADLIGSRYSLSINSGFETYTLSPASARL